MRAIAIGPLAYSRAMPPRRALLTDRSGPQPRAPTTILRGLRPTNNVLPGYTPSELLDRAQDDDG